ncbi:MAG TPA: HNH endonuclease signature motif containing protein [Solirubrobacterales bacterium]|nr:HNH endonuclease signature motif containing protein [Solirubrobacterales bacterium]
MPIEFSCLDCGRISTQKRCPTHRRKRRRQRKVEGLTGERGSTRAGREARRRVLKAAEDPGGTPRCFYCPGEATVADHYVPLAKGGTDTEDNLVAACTRCNSEKGDQLPELFMAQRRRPSGGGGSISSREDRTPPGASPRKKAKSGKG